MTIHREVELVRMTHQEALSYVPPAGIDVNFIEWRNENGKEIQDSKQIIPFAKQVVIEFLCSDLNPDPILKKSIKDIHHELMTSDYFRNRIIRRDLGSHPKLMKRGMMVETNLDSPLVTHGPEEIRRAAEEAIDVHDILLTQEEADNAVLESSFEFGKYAIPIAGGSGGRYTRKVKLPTEGIEVVQERFYRQVGPEQALQEEYGPEKLKYQMGIIDSG